MIAALPEDLLCADCSKNASVCGQILRCSDDLYCEWKPFTFIKFKRPGIVCGNGTSTVKATLDDKQVNYGTAVSPRPEAYNATTTISLSDSTKFAISFSLAGIVFAMAVGFGLFLFMRRRAVARSKVHVLGFPSQSETAIEKEFEKKFAMNNDRINGGDSAVRLEHTKPSLSLSHLVVNVKNTEILFDSKTPVTPRGISPMTLRSSSANQAYAERDIADSRIFVESANEHA